MEITVELSHALQPDQDRQLLDFCNGIGAPAPIQMNLSGQVADTAASAPPRFPGRRTDDALFTPAFRTRPAAPAFVRADEAFWFPIWIAFTR